MGSNKLVCLMCKRTANSQSEIVCSKCGQSMTVLPHRFRPPKESEQKKCDVVKYLVENGFYFQHIYKAYPFYNMDSHENYAVYPKTKYEAKEFIEKFKKQSR
jgi:hypothetical protein